MNVSIEECPRCGALDVDVERQEQVLVTECGHLVTELEVRQKSEYGKREVAEL